MTKKKFESYVEIQRSGLTNMWDIKVVIDLSGGKLTKKDCLDIMENYDKYIDKFSKMFLKVI